MAVGVPEVRALWPGCAPTENSRGIPFALPRTWHARERALGAEVRVYRSQHLEIMVKELSIYAPDLNPEEGCHGDVKRHLLNATPEDSRQIRQ